MTMRLDECRAMKQTNTIKQLKRLLLLKQQEAREAVLERERLTGRLFLLSALCNVLRWRRDTIRSAVLGLEEGQASPEVSLGNEAVEQTLLELERAIADHTLSRSRNTVDQMDIDGANDLGDVRSGCATAHAAAAIHLHGDLAGAAAPGTPSTAAAASVEQDPQQQQGSYQQYKHLYLPLQQQIAPPDDPLVLFKHLFLQPLSPGVASMSLPQVLAEYGQLARELSGVLQLHEKGLGAGQEARLQELLLRWEGCLCCCCCCCCCCLRCGKGCRRHALQGNAAYAILSLVTGQYQHGWSSLS
jgi:hypothetical protein